jgi:hypothetical protein
LIKSLAPDRLAGRAGSIRKFHGNQAHPRAG